MAASAAPGTVEKTTVFKEYVPADSAQDPRKRQRRTPIWEFLPTVSAEDWKNLRYEIRLYRYNPQTEKRMAVEKIYELIDPFWVQKKYGGGKYNVLVQEDAQLIYNEDFECLGEPKVPVPGANGTNGAPAAGSDAVALQALHLMSNPEMMRGMFQMYNMAAQQSMEMIRAQMPAPVDALATLRNAKEILGIGEHKDNLLDTIRVLKELGIVGSPEKKGVTEVLELITTLKGSGLIATSQKPDLASTFLANLPALADRMVNGLHEFRLQTESTERAMRLQRGEIRPGDPGVITVDPSAPPSSAPQNGPTAGSPAVAPTPGAMAGGQSVDEATAQAIIIRYNLERLVAGIKEPNSTGEDMYDFLINAWPEIIPALAEMNKETLLAFFKSAQFQQERLGNTVLMAVADDPRLPKIIEEFLATVKKVAAEKK
jgi:hypothetical protein